MGSQILEDTFLRWINGFTSVEEQMISIFNHIRDIPYAIGVKQNDTVCGSDALLINGYGSCVPKHHLLVEYLSRLNIQTRFITIPFFWDDPMIQYPADIRALASSVPLCHHLACQIQIGERWILVDATWDPPLQSAGFPVNLNWDGRKDTFSAVTPVQIKKKSDFYGEIDIRTRQPTRESFIKVFNAWLKDIRRKNSGSFINR